MAARGDDGRMSDDDSEAVARRRPHAAERRDRRLNIRLNDDEYDRVAEYARAAGMSMGTYAARSALRGERLAGLLWMSDLSEAQQALGVLLRLQADLVEAVDEGAGPAVEAVIERIDRVMDQIEATLT